MQRYAGRSRHLPKPVQQAALRRVVHRARPAAKGDPRLRPNAYARAIQQPLGSADGRARQGGEQLLVELPRECGCAFNGDSLGDDQDIAGLDAIGCQHAPAGRDADHESHDDRPIQAGRHFRVAPDQVHIAQLAARLVDLGEYPLGHGGLTGRQEQVGKEPSRLGAGGEDVVGVDVHGVLADLVDGVCHRVAGEHERALFHGDGGGIQADFRPDEHGRVVSGGVTVQQSAERFG